MLCGKCEDNNLLDTAFCSKWWEKLEAVCERRQLAVMFCCDLVGSTSFSKQLDLEET
jgi:hypothetical protein